jgi:hypothetical protein
MNPLGVLIFVFSIVAVLYMRRQSVMKDCTIEFLENVLAGLKIVSQFKTDLLGLAPQILRRPTIIESKVDTVKSTFPFWQRSYRIVITVSFTEVGDYEQTKRMLDSFLLRFLSQATNGKFVVKVNYKIVQPTGGIDDGEL